MATQWVKHDDLTKTRAINHVFTFYIEKNNFDNNEGQWIVDGLQQSKKQWQIAMPPRWEANWNLILDHGVPAIQKNSAIKENVQLV